MLARPQLADGLRGVRIAGTFSDDTNPCGGGRSVTSSSSFLMTRFPCGSDHSSIDEYAGGSSLLSTHPRIRDACVLGTILSRAENHALRENMLVLLCCGPRRVDQLCPRDARRLQMEVEGMTVRSRDSEGVGTSIRKPAGGNVWKHR